MRHFRATNRDTQEVVEYDADLPQAEHRNAPWRLEEVFVGTSPDPGPPEPPRVYQGRRQLTRLEFMRLFTSAERIAIRDFVAGTTAPAKAGRDFMAMMELSNEVDLDDADTVNGVNFMEARGLIAAGRAEEILAG